MFYVYILKNSTGNLYVGHTNNLERRTSEHSNRRGAKFTKDHEVLEMVYQEASPTRSEAMQREKQIKGWSRAKKIALISSDMAELKRLSTNHQRKRPHLPTESSSNLPS